MKGLRATESHSADRAAQKRYRNPLMIKELRLIRKSKFKSFVSHYFSNSAVWITFCFGCAARSAEWLSVARSPFIVNRDFRVELPPKLLHIKEILFKKYTFNIGQSCLQKCCILRKSCLKKDTSNIEQNCLQKCCLLRKFCLKNTHPIQNRVASKSEIF